jgi:hypothetical protein
MKSLNLQVTTFCEFSVLCFLLSCTDECTGNGGLGSMEHSATTGRLGLGLLVGLEGEALGSGALLARDRDNQLFLGLGGRRVWAETAWCRTFDRQDFGDDGRDSLVDGACSQRWQEKIPAEHQGTKGLALTRARARLPGKFPPRKHPWNPVFVDEDGYLHFVQTRLLLFLLQSRSSHSLACSAWQH